MGVVWFRPGQRASLCVLLVFGCILAACGSEPDGALEAEIAAVRESAAAELALAQSESRLEVAELEEALEQQRLGASTEVADLTTRLETATEDLREARDQSATLESQLGIVTIQLQESQDRLTHAEAETTLLLTKYDAEIRAEAQAAWDAELTSACEKAGSGNLLVSNYVEFSAELSVIGTESELVEAVSECAEPLRDRSEEEKLSAECEPGSIDAVTKDPGALAGNCYVVYVIPSQWDSRTGACNFLGSWDPNNLGMRRLSYDGDGLFRAPNDVCETDLPEADQDDLVQVWVTLQGPYRYDTAAGGTNEVPEFSIRRAVLISKG